MFDRNYPYCMSMKLLFTTGCKCQQINCFSLRDKLLTKIFLWNYTRRICTLLRIQIIPSFFIVNKEGDKMFNSAST